MISVKRHPATFGTFNFDIYPWLCVGAAVVVTAAGLVVVGTGMQERPVLVTRASEPVRSMADSYVRLRHRVETMLPAPRSTNDPAEILGREAAIGTAVRAARPHAMQGEVFTSPLTENVRAMVTADLTRRSASDRESLMNDVPAIAPHVNELYPASEALATFPPLLLQVLPRLPDDLEYRFMGRDLIIRDARTNLIVDYLPDVVTATIAP